MFNNVDLGFYDEYANPRGKDLNILGCKLVMTCFACPEQYDVYYNDTQIGYLRLRHGTFTADYPDCGGEQVYTAHPVGDGIFEDNEREYYLTNAIKELLHKHIPDYNKTQPMITQQEFVPGTKNHEIFNLSAPYNNPYQGNKPKVLFVCSAGLLRSPTGAYVAQTLGFNSRSCGSSSYALIPLSVNLIMWADEIYFVSGHVYREAKNTFENSGYLEDIEAKATVLEIPDVFNAFDPKLQQEFEAALSTLVTKYANRLY